MPARDWVEWHDLYDDPDSPLARRLLIVQRAIREALDRAPEGPVQVVSLCAGQGRDLIGAIANHPRREDVVARLVELDERNVDFARDLARVEQLEHVQVVAGDAGLTNAYVGAVPARLVLACGVFGNIDDADVVQTIRLLPQLCAAGAEVIWTRHRRAADLTPTIRRWFEDAEFDEVSFEAPEDDLFGVGANRFRGEPMPLQPGVRLFTFVGDARAHS
jgi:hypothetical protein